MSNRWIDVPEIIKRSGRSRRTVLQALGNGALNGEKPGRAWRSRESTVDLWIEKGSKAIPPQSATAVREVKEPPPGETLTIAEASKYLFLTPHEVREQVRAGRLPLDCAVFVRH